MTITEREAYRKGVRSRGTNVDWDDALVRFTARYCPHPTYGAMCPLCHAWCDGFGEVPFGTPLDSPDRDPYIPPAANPG